VSAGRGFFPPAPLTEETEAAGLSRLSVADRLIAERGTSSSLDVTRTFDSGSITATLFGSWVADALDVDRSVSYVMRNQDGRASNMGVELLATFRRGAWAATSTYTFVRSRERDVLVEQEAPLTPRHSAGVVGMWESEYRGRAGVELYFTGRQRLDDNPFRDSSRPYVIVGFLAERRLGRLRLFVNAENITDVRQTRWDRLVRPARAADGRWTVDAWAPLDGRAINGGLRVAF
jgi:iron complex outermembrane receptor protein